MGKSYSNPAVFASAFEVQATRPLDARLVLDSVNDLTNGTIDYPYVGLVVNIKGTSKLWILLTSGIEASHHKENWELVTGSGSGGDVEQIIQEVWDRLGLTESDIDNIKENIGDFLTSSDLDGYVKIEDLDDFLTSSDLDGYVKIEKLEDYIPKTELENLVKKSDLNGYVRFEDVADFLTASDIPTKLSEFINDAGYLKEKDIEDIKNGVNDIKEGLGTVTALVGDPGTENDEPTGIFEELDTLKKNVKGASLSNYILPVMTQDMVDAATEDSDVDFDGSEDPHIIVEYNPLDTTPRTNDDIYMGLIHDMMGAIRSLQAEVARLRNTFDYGIDSYKNTRTAKSVTLGGMNDVDIDEPLWAIDPGYLSLVSDNPNFKAHIFPITLFIPSLISLTSSSFFNNFLSCIIYSFK